MEEKPRLFIGSSTEGKAIAHAIAHQLHDILEVTVWENGVFGLGSGTLETLLHEASEFDFAAMIFTADDEIISRGEAAVSPRDNVLLECGIFLATLGRDRAFVVYDGDDTPKIPTDLAGITHAIYRSKRSDGNVDAAVLSACHPIRTSVRKLGRRHSKRSPMETVAPVESNRITVWLIGSADELPEREARFVSNLAPDLANHLARAGARLVMGESELLRSIARAYRSAVAGLPNFVPNPIIVFGDLRKHDPRMAFSETIGCIPDLAIVIGGRLERGRVREEYERAKEAGIPILSLGFTGGAAATLSSTVSSRLEEYVGKPISALDAGKIAAEIATVIETRTRGVTGR